jgi:hypothetical protein
MKKLGRLIWVTVFLSAIFLSCTRNDGLLNNTALKQAVNTGASGLNSAMANISSSQAYSVLTAYNGNLKSATVTDSTYKVYIPLSLVKGVYAYKPLAKVDRWGISLIQFFTKTADNSQMIVQMPLKKVKNPGALRHYSAADSSLVNNFSISVSDYHNNYNSYWDYDYILASEIDVDNVLAGKLNINSIVSPTNGIHYTSQYVFTDSYTAQYKYDSGDTTVSSFAIMSNNNTLYKEELLTIRNDTARFGREHQYILTIGDVQILRKSGSKTVQIAVNGVLQPDAVVTIVDQAQDSEASVCKKRDIQITFEDGTITTVSALIGKSIDSIKTLFDSLHQVYFAAYVVDWIAYDIYYQRD